MDTYGEDTIITTKERDIELVPRLNKTVCLIFDNGDAVTSGIGAGSFVAGSTPVGTLWSQQPGLRMTLWKLRLRRTQLSLADGPQVAKSCRCCQTCQTGHTWENAN